ncbi:hypothetical protein CDD82_6546 [Ophiocordyceps australis]|uniref:Peroxisomal membrane protein PEX17 n=1 Tax=Ophiocordyceps australis TaxID=1399860 RepID=A0A2C5YV24_9HYPO|nr:hypothetical protein CDD82_6546 [Ophiocordyceps australis]
MPADRLLNTVLQHYQDVHDAAKTDQVMGSTAHLLSHLSNPLNLTLLTSQLLTAPAIWNRIDDDAQAAMRIISLYHSAARRLRQGRTQEARRSVATQASHLGCDEWVRAVVKGADDKSRPWQHLLVLTGVLIGMEGDDKPSISRSLCRTLQQAIVTAANLALDQASQHGQLAAASIVLALNFAFSHISEFHRSQINCDALLPLVIWALGGEQGLYDGHFLDAIARDTVADASRVLSWPAQSPSGHMLQELEKQPLVANAGPISKLAAFAVHHARDSSVVLQAHDALLLFTARVFEAWQSMPFSDIDPAFESIRLTPETMQSTWPLLWQLLKKLMFATVAVVQAVVSRSLLDANMFANTVASAIATKTLHILRNLFFISCRNGNSAFQVYTFTYLTSIDVVTRNSVACEKLLEEYRQARQASFAASHLDRILDLFYLNLAEHFPLSLSTRACQALIIEPAMAYLGNDGPQTPFMVEVFESAHSAILSVLCCPQQSSLTMDIAPTYIFNLFDSFPHDISPRQFRVAFKTVMEIVSPPYPIAGMRPELSETLLEMLRSLIPRASTAPLNPTPDVLSRDMASQQGEMLSEQSALILAMVDSLPFLPLALVQEWLTITANLMNGIPDAEMRAPAKKRFLDLLVNGELDVDRASMGLAWWTEHGGRDLVLFGGPEEPIMMSGALVSNGEKTSRL